MDLMITSRNTEVSDRLHQYVTRKIEKLNRFLPNIAAARVELMEVATKDIEDRQVVQVTLWVNGTILRGEESAGDFFASVDAVIETLQKQIERYKGRAWFRRRRLEAMRKEEEQRAAEAWEQELAGTTEELERPERVVRRKRFAVMSMDEEEAIEQMELLGHDFFVFYHADSGRINVIYRRRNGDYGLIDPE